MVFKEGISDVKYTLSLQPITKGILWWKKVVFEWQILKMYQQHYEVDCNYTAHVEDGQFKVISVVESFSESQEALARSRLSKYQNSLEV